MFPSRKSIRSKMIAGSAVLTSVAALTVGVGTASASANTTAEFIEYTITSIKELNGADVDLQQAIKELKAGDNDKAAKTLVAARQHVHDFYYDSYDPQLEGPSRSLNSVNGHMRKPMMEGFKNDAINSISACIADIASCDTKVLVDDVYTLRQGVARDGLLLAGIMADDKGEEAYKKQDAAATTLIKFVTDNPAAANDIIKIAEKDSDSPEPAKIAADIIAKKVKVTKGHIHTDTDGWIATLLHPQTWSSEIKSYTSSNDEDGDNANPSPVAIAAIVATVAAVAAAFFWQAHGKLPMLPFKG